MSTDLYCKVSSKCLRAGLRFSLLPVLAVLLAAGQNAAPKPDFGPNVLVFNPSLPAAAIQEQIDKAGPPG